MDETTGIDPHAGPDHEHALVRHMARIATDLLASLEPQMRARALWAPFDDSKVEAERVRWFYTPTDHGGVALRELSPAQQSLAMQLLASGLTRQAYVTACAVLGLENVLDEIEGWTADWGRERGRDPGSYWVRFFGHPDETTWGWRFGGHHVSVNLLLHGGRIVATTPSFLGADPATSPLLGGELRPLGGTEELGRTLMASLGEREQAQALLHPRAISDIVSGNRAYVRPGDRMMRIPDLFRGAMPTPRLAALVDRADRSAQAQTGYTDADHGQMALGVGPQGIAAHDLTTAQRGLLRTLIAAHTDRSPQPVADSQRYRYAQDNHLDAVHFGWAGDAAPGQPHYYRLTGPRLLIEYDNTQRGANHAHSVWRDPVGDFGLDPLSSHRTTFG